MTYAAHRHREPESRLADYLAEARALSWPRRRRRSPPRSRAPPSLAVGPDFEALRWFWLPHEVAARVASA